MLTIFGLGNPGAGYKKTRHNAGFMLVDGIADGRLIKGPFFEGSTPKVLARIFGRKPAFNKTSGPFLSLEGSLFGTEFILVKPTTFMNESGKAVTSLLTRGICKNVSELLVVTDDVDIETGRLRLRTKGSAGGHNGIKSIISHLGTDEFARLKIGAGPRPDGDELVDYVLSSFRPEEFETLDISLVKAAEVVFSWISGGINRANCELS